MGNACSAFPPPHPPRVPARPSKATSPGERGLASRWAVKTAEVAEVVEAAEAYHHLRAKALDLTSGGVLRKQVAKKKRMLELALFGRSYLVP